MDTKYTEEDLTRFTCSAASIRELRSLFLELKLKVFLVILCTVCQQLIIIFREHISQLNVVPIEYFPKLCAAPNLVITLKLFRQGFLHEIGYRPFYSGVIWAFIFVSLVVKLIYLNTMILLTYQIFLAFRQNNQYLLKYIEILF